MSGGSGEVVVVVGGGTGGLSGSAGCPSSAELMKFAQIRAG
ncbi:MAG: hypothetical protein M5U19_04875 [Microthrixaceae bacterium]|nr:hypothetical protein [Microthrixaceae bacterium]